MAAAGQGSGPQARIVNGALTTGYVTTAALLVGGSQSSAVSSCTATLIGCSTLLTAAHCVCGSFYAPCQGSSDPDPGGYLVFFQHYGFAEVSDIIVNESYDGVTLGADLALIVLTEAVAGITPTARAAAIPAVGERATIVGFGRGGGSDNDYGLKRYGQVTTATCANGSGAHVCWNFDCMDLDNCDDANTCNGDSGGPLFVTEGGAEVLAGVTSWGINAQCLAEDRSYDTSVAYWSDWITASAPETLGTDSCGVVPHIGTSGRIDVNFVDGELTATEADETKVVVAADTGELRIAVNAEDSGIEDFRVAVKDGGVAGASYKDCGDSGSSQYAYCQFTDPGSGAWYVKVSSVSGSGQWQLTSTHINAGSGTACGDPTGDGTVLVSDALAILKKAVGISSQCRHCYCDMNSDSSVTVTDALLALKTAVGIEVLRDCLSCVDSTTTTTVP